MKTLGGLFLGLAVVIQGTGAVPALSGKGLAASLLLAVAALLIVRARARRVHGELLITPPSVARRAPGNVPATGIGGVQRSASRSFMLGKRRADLST